MRFGLPAAVILLLAGCPPPAVDFGTHGRVDDPAPLLASLDARRAKVLHVTGEARADLDGPQGAGGLDLYVVTESPDRLRVEALSFFGSPVAVLVADAGAVKLHDLQSGRFLVATGDGQDALVSKLVPVALGVPALVSLLLGAPLAIEDDGRRALELDVESRAWKVTLKHGPWTQQLWFDATTWRPVRSALDDGAGHGHKAVLEEFDGPLDLPKRITLKSTDGRSEARFRWKTRDFDSVAEPGTFTLDPPEGVVPESP